MPETPGQTIKTPLNLGVPFGLRLADFHRRVDPERCKCTVRSSRITLKLVKQEPEHWWNLLQNSSPGPSAVMASGSSDTTSCEPINSGYAGTIQISCFFGVLTANPSGCSPKPCAQGDQLDVTLDGATSTITLGREVKSGTSTTAFCSDVNSAWGNSFTLSCNLGTLSFDVSNCQAACTTSATMDVTLADSTVSVSPTATLLSGETEFNIPCSGLHSGFTGVYTLSCVTGDLAADTSQCTERGCLATDTVDVTVGSSTNQVAASEALSHGGSIEQLCEEVNTQYTGTLTISCSKGAVSLASSTCNVKPCEPWDFVAATLQGASGLLYPKDQIPSGSTGTGECGDVNVEWSGDFVLACTLGVLQAGDSSACRRTCSSYGSNTTVTIDGSSYTVSPAARISHLGNGVQACGNVVYGYGGEVQLSCDDGTLSVTSHSCLPEPCPAGLLIEATVYGVSGVSQLLADVAHGGQGPVDCNLINPETTGTFQAACSAKSLSLVNESACTRSCTETSPVQVQLDGDTFTVIPAQLIEHGNSAWQNCSTFTSGYSGEIQLGCNDNVTQVASEQCIPNACADPRTDGATTVDAYDNWYGDCSAVNPSLVGQIHYSCIGGQIRTNSSACQGPCNHTQNASEETLSGGVENVSCTIFLGSQWDGMAYLLCTDGVSTADTAGCAEACYPTESATVTVVGESNDASFSARTKSGETETMQCSSLDAAYHGTLTLSCNNGLLSPSHACHKMCTTSTSANAVVGGQSVTVSPASDILHQGTLNTTCDGAVSSYANDIVLSCNEGVLSADASACKAPCSTGSDVTVNFAGSPHSLSLTSQILHGQTGTESCSDADSGYMGDIVIRCSDGMATQSSEACTEKPCEEELAYQLSVAGESLGKELASETPHAATIIESCTEANNAYDGIITVTCIRGGLTADPSACVPACLTSYTTELSLGSTNYTVSPLNRTAEGGNETQQCSALGPEHGGTLTVSCSSGVVSATSNCVVGCSSTVLDQVVDIVDKTGGKYPNLTSGVYLKSGENATMDCPSSMYSGSMTFSCSSGVPTLTHNCVPLPCPANDTILLELDGSSLNYSLQAENVHAENTTVECSSVNSDWQQNLQVMCRYGRLESDASTCAGVPCGTSTSAGVSVGWLNATLNPDTEVAHASTWTVLCYSINTEFSGDINLRCKGGTVLADASCQQEEVGCRPSGQYASETAAVGNYSVVLGPSTTVASGGTWEVDCESNTEGNYLGKITVTCGALGSYTSVDNQCVERHCPAGTSLTVSKAGYTGTVVTSADIAHAAVGTASCTDVDEGLQGNLALTCDWGVVSVDTSACDVVCLPSRPGQAFIAGTPFDVAPPVDILDGRNFSIPCVDLMAGYNGNVVGTCSGGSVNADSSNCVGMPCEAGEGFTITLYDKTDLVNLTADLASGATATFPCSSVNSDYAGDISFRCLADVLRKDVSGCVCQDQACSIAPCMATDTFFVQLTDTEASVAIGEQVSSLQTVSRTCESAAPGHDGSFSVLCSGGVLHPDLTTCTERGCDASTAAAQFSVGGTAAQATTSQAVSHGGSFVWGSCASVNPNFIGSVNATCHLGELLVDRSGCEPKPCAAGTMANFALGGATAELAASAFMEHLGVASFDCAAVNPDFHGTFEATCAFGNISGVTSTCVENPCASSSYVEAELGGTTSQQYSPGVLHGATWTVPCEPINWDYVGDMQMSCYRGHVRADNSSCILVELGCQPTGPGGNVTVGNYTVDLRPVVGVSKDETFQVDCSSQTQRKYVGEITVTCGRRGSYASMESGCEPRSCVGGEALLVQSQYVNGSVLSSDMAHLQAINVTCENVSEVLRGDVQITCDYGDFQLSHSCYSVCLPSRPAQATLGGKVHDVITPEVLASGRGYFLPCNDFVANYSGTVNISCLASDLLANTSDCMPDPCQDEIRSISHEGLDLTVRLAGSNLGTDSPTPSGYQGIGQCSTLDEMLVGTYSVTCEAAVYGLDLSNCFLNSCEPPSAGLASLGSHVQAVRVQNKLIEGGREAFPCTDVSSEFSGEGELVCVSGRLYASSDNCNCASSACAGATCDSSVRVVASQEGYTTVIHASKTLADGETEAGSCGQVLPNSWTGQFVGTCTNGVLSVDLSQCQPGPCVSQTTGTVQVGGKNYTATVSAEKPHGAEWTGLCSDYDAEYEGGVSLSCSTGLVFADGSGCVERSCTESQRTLTFEDGVVNVTITPLALGVPNQTTPSGFSNSSVSCKALSSAIDGAASPDLS
eukprot:s3236_g1.t1